jgi:GNAT superfamily N-acetyltransferase
MQRDSGSSEVEVRRATADDARAIGAVFDAAVRAGWTYLGELAQKPMFAPEDWDQLVADHGPPKVLLVATDRAGQVVGYTAAHPDDGEMFLLFVHPAHAGRGIGRTLLGAAHDALRAAGCRQAYLYTHELVDRFRLMTFPLVLGSGRRLFNDGILPATMRPAGLAVTDLGIVIGTYEPAGPVRHGQM